MKKLIARVLTLVFTLTVAAAFAEEPVVAPSKALVVFFSATGNTGRIAELIAQDAGADVFVLEPTQAYTSADLNWTDDNSRVVYEHEHPEAQNDVALNQITPENWADYDTVYIGYPIWWGNAAWPVNHFITGNDFTGKAVVPFCTSSSSGLGESDKLLSEMAGTGVWLDGHRFSSGADESAVLEWMHGLEPAIAQAVEQAAKER